MFRLRRRHQRHLQQRRQRERLRQRRQRDGAVDVRLVDQRLHVHGDQLQAELGDQVHRHHLDAHHLVGGEVVQAALGLARDFSDLLAVEHHHVVEVARRHLPVEDDARGADDVDHDHGDGREVEPELVGVEGTPEKPDKPVRQPRNRERRGRPLDHPAVALKNFLARKIWRAPLT